MVIDFKIKTTLLKINPKFPKIYSGWMDIIKVLWIVIQPTWKLTKIFLPILTIILAYQICGQPTVVAAGRKENFISSPEGRVLVSSDSTFIVSQYIPCDMQDIDGKSGSVIQNLKEP